MRQLTNFLHHPENFRQSTRLLGFLLVIALIVLSLTACGGTSSRQASISGASGVETAELAQVAPAEDAADHSAASSVAANTAGQSQDNGEIPPLTSQTFDPRQIIKNAKIRIEVENLLDATEGIAQSVSLVGGYVVRTQVSYAENHSSRVVQRAWMTVRVPSESFDSTLQTLRDLGIPQEEEIRTQDVTEEHLDLKARITNLTAQEEQLRRLLSETSDIGQIMEVYDRLTKVRSEIDQLQGRLQVLENQVAFSTIELTLMQVSSTALSDPKSPVITRAWQSLVESIAAITAGTKELIVWMGGALPYLVLLVILFWGLHRGWRHLKRRGKGADEAPDA